MELSATWLALYHCITKRRSSAPLGIVYLISVLAYLVSKILPIETIITYFTSYLGESGTVDKDDQDQGEVIQEEQQRHIITAVETRRAATTRNAIATSMCNSYQDRPSVSR